MTHTMNLDPSPFGMIKSGIKTIELRLYDEKRRLINAGDTIVFTSTENSADTLKVRVLGMHIFDSFETLYKELPLLKCGYTREDIDTASPNDMDIYYSKERQKKYGVVGIEIETV